MRTFELRAFNNLMEQVMRIKKRLLSTNYKDRPTIEDKQWIMGGSTLTLRPEFVNLYINEDLRKIYGRENLTLKIFYNPYPLEMNFYNCHWSQQSRLFESTSIQNIFAFYGYAPFISDLVFLKNGFVKYIAQVTEFISSETIFDKEIEDNYKKEINDFCETNGFLHYDLDRQNLREKKITDFQGYRFIRKDNIYGNFLSIFIERIKKGLSFGGDENLPYQSVEELDIVGRRSNLKRQEFINLKGENLGDRWSVLDIGCNGGYFLRRAMDNGASMALGVDTYKVAETAHWLNNYLGYFNAKFQEEMPQEKFDVVLFLSGFSYFNLDTVCSLSNNLMFFEGHGNHKAEEYIPLLKPHFKNIQVLGSVNDYPESGKRVIIRCQK